MKSITIAKREMKLGFRNPWAYTFLLAFSLFSIALLFLNTNAQAGIGKYTTTTGTMMNLLLYFLPLMTLMLGSFSISTEKEDGNWQLLLTYPLASFDWLFGKYLGIFIVIMTIVAFGLGTAGIIGFLFGINLALETGGFLFVFSLMLIFVFLAIAILIGTISKSRWQALAMSVSVWMVFVLAWPIMIISALGSLNYSTLKLVLQIVTLLNPAEFIRIYSIIQLGGGAVFGPEYIHWVGWASSNWGTVYFLILCIVWFSFLMFTAIYVTERGRSRG